MYCLCANVYYCHRVTTQLQLTNISYHIFFCVFVGFSPVKYMPFIATRTLYSLMDSIWMRSPSITLSYPASLITEISGILTTFAKSPTLILHCEWELSGCKPMTFHLTWQMLDYLCLIIIHDTAESKNFLFVIKKWIKKKKCESRYFFIHSLHSMNDTFTPQYYFSKYSFRYSMNRRVIDSRHSVEKRKIFQPADNHPQFLDLFCHRPITIQGCDKSLARQGRKQTTATEDFEFHISYL